jgi:GNAT superfamily N-acetyltransferase
VPVLDVIRFWRALDDFMESVEPTGWGAVVTDRRYPVIWDANYARVDRPAEDLRLEEVEASLTPALVRAGATSFHVVMFEPERTTRLMTELSARGDRLSWDVVMIHEGSSAADSPRVEELSPGPELWEAVRVSLRHFGIAQPSAITQLVALERDALGSVKRWFGVREHGRLLALGALVLLEGVGYVDNVATEPESRGRGYASDITSRIVLEARAGGAETVFLLAEPEGPVRLYERIGFREAMRLASTLRPAGRAG